MEEINSREPRISNAIVEGVVIRAARRHNLLWTDTVMLLQAHEEGPGGDKW
jgi:hypothetical protein